jgi:hypothetical protein
MAIRDATAPAAVDALRGSLAAGRALAPAARWQQTAVRTKPPCLTSLPDDLRYVRARLSSRILSHHINGKESSCVPIFSPVPDVAAWH